MRTANVRTYGAAPFGVAVIHGGPGAPGEMAPVARALSQAQGVLEPLQTADSLDGQVEELRAALEAHTQLPVVLIGASWGAMLSLLVTARYPALVRKVVLVGCPPLDPQYAGQIMETRLSRLNAVDRRQAERLIAALSRAGAGAAPSADDLAAFGRLMAKADHVAPLTLETEVVEVQPDIFRKVWGEAERLRGSEELLVLARRIRCPVVVIHGDYDPHPYQGVIGPLSGVLADVRLHLLPRCGHQPWIEREARDAFYDLLQNELASA